MGTVTMYLGIEIEWNRATHEAWIHQESYITYLCSKYGLNDTNPVSLPMDPNHLFGRIDEAHPDIPDLQHAYRKIIGELIYLSTCSRPNIALTVQWLSQQCVQPEPRHFLAARRVIRYLKGTLSLHIHFGNPNVNLSLHAFSDSNWATSPEDRVSITGYVWYFHGGTISHASKKQTTSDVVGLAWPESPGLGLA